MWQPQMSRVAHLKMMNSDFIYSALKKDILALKLRPGQMLSENEIAELYQVSRTPVKGAFIRLESEGFINVVPQRGTFVTLIDFKQIQDILYVRYVLEVDILKKILLDPCLDGILGKLRESLHKQERLIAQGNLSPEAFFEPDSQFHALLFSHVGREQIWSFIQENHLNYTRFRLLDTHVTARYNQLYQDHMNIFHALSDRDEQRLDKCVYDHLHNLIEQFSRSASGEHRSYLINFED